MEHSPSCETNTFSAVEEILCLFFFYGTGKFITLFKTTGHLSLSLAIWIVLPSSFFKIYLSIILLFTPRSSTLSVFLRFSTKILHAFFFSPIHATYFITGIMASEKYTSWSCSLPSFLLFPVNSSSLAKWFFSASCSRIPAFYPCFFFLNARHQVSHPCKQQGIFLFWVF